MLTIITTQDVLRWAKGMLESNCGVLSALSILVAILSQSVSISALAGGGSEPDPYDILDRHYESMGYLDTQSSDRTSFELAELFDSCGSKIGILRQWTKTPCSWRRELVREYDAFIGGDNGDVLWDAKEWGTIDTIEDSAALAYREYEISICNLEHLDEKSNRFDASYVDLAFVDDLPCYLIQVVSTLKPERSMRYIDTLHLYLRRSVEIMGHDTISDVVMSDFRTVDGVVQHFRQEGYMEGQQVKTIWKMFLQNVDLNDSIFEPCNTVLDDPRFGGDLTDAEW